MGDHATDDVNQVDDVEKEIDTLRQRTEDLIAELEHRVGGTLDRAKSGVDRVKAGMVRARELADVPTQVRAHPRAAAGVGAGTLALLGLGAWLLFSRRAQDRRMARRFRRRAHAYRELLAHPELALAPRGPSLSQKLITAIAVTAATQLLKRAIRSA